MSSSQAATGDTETTTDHGTIRDWAEARDGTPATVRTTGDDDEPGILRIRFSDEARDDLEDVSWEAFFQKFEEEELAFLYQERTSGGGMSRFHKFVERQ